MAVVNATKLFNVALVCCNSDAKSGNWTSWQGQRRGPWTDRPPTRRTADSMTLTTMLI